ncbi:hypothetical protein ScPMuIL_008613 [Solemya velum]
MSHGDDTEFEELNNTQRLKAALHYTVVQICKEVAMNEEVNINRQFVASLTETTWKQSEEFARDLEAFAKHAKRSTVNADDVKMLVRKSGSLHRHISELHQQRKDDKETTKKKQKSKKSKAPDEAVDDDSNM